MGLVFQSAARKNDVVVVVVVVLLLSAHGKQLWSHYFWAGLDPLLRLPKRLTKHHSDNSVIIHGIGRAMFRLPFLHKRKEKRKDMAGPGIKPGTSGS